MFIRGPHILSKEDADAMVIIEKQFISENITMLTNTGITKVEENEKGQIVNSSTFCFCYNN